MAENSRYILVKKLARGGMAEIYLGRKEAEDGFTQLVCIKRILPHYSQEKEYIEMFRDEAHICKRLQHGNIVRVESFEEVEDSYAIIMEYVNGSDLRKLLVACESANEPIPLAMLIYIVAEAAKGLHYAHTKIDEITQKPLHIVHRDVSPQNILVSFDGEVKITDFGIADAKNKSTETKPGIVKGKYSYMSPEQIMAKQVDARTDVFALAIILWEMVAMERLFHAENDVITIQKVKNGEIKPLPMNKRSEGEIDEDLVKIIHKGLQKDLKKRYKDASHFEQALRSYLNKRFPQFNQLAFSEFLKRVLKTEVDESQATIKEVLTTVKEKPRKKTTVVEGFELAETEKPQGGFGENAELNLNALQFQIASQSSARKTFYPSGSPVSQSMSQSSGPSVPASKTIHQVSKSSPSKTGLNKPHATEKTNGNQKRPQVNARFKSGAKKSSFSSMSVVYAILVLGILGALGFIGNQFFLSRNPFVEVAIRTSPNNVMISINDQDLKNGQYIKTPMTQKLKIGTHTIKISRPGYQTSTYKFVAKPTDAIQKIDVALKRTANMAPVIIKPQNNNDKNIWIDINKGMHRGKIPVKVGNLVFGMPHSMKVFPQYPDEKNSFSCSFTPTSKDWSSPFIVVINTNSEKCFVTNN